MAFNLFPYSNFHKLNLDWVIQQIKEAMTALEAASQTVTTYESRLSSVEADVDSLGSAAAELQRAVIQHTAQIQEASQNIVNLTTRMTIAETRMTIAETNAADALEAANEANETAAGLASQVTQAAQDASQALTNSSTALEAATTASSETQRLQREKLDKLGADAQEVLGVTGNSESAAWPFYIKRTGTDPADYETFYANPISRNILELSSESKSGNAVSVAAPILRGVGTPLEVSDAANKAYVDGFQTSVVGSSVEITPANNTIYKCGVLEQLTISNPPSAGAYSIIFTSGATPTTTIIPATILGLETFVAAANTIYEINVLDNRAVVGSWEVASA